MSKFDTVLDTLRTYIPTLVGFEPASKSELPNPYSMEQNLEPLLKNGWGIRVGGAATGPAEFNSLVDSHQFDIVLTREVVKTDNNPEPLVAAVKGLKSDASLLQRSLEGGGVLGLGDETLERFTYISTTSIEFGNGERYKWVMITVSFVASIREDLA